MSSSLIFYKEKINDNGNRYWIKRKRTHEIIGIEDESWHREFFPFTTIWKFDDSLGSGGDFTTGMLRARDSMETTGGVIFLPPGVYLGTETITIDTHGVNILGAGWGTKITRSTDYGDTFLFTGTDASGTRLINCGIQHVYIESTGLMTSGAHIHTNGVQKQLVDRIWMQDGFIGGKFDGCGGGSNIDRIYLVFGSLFGGNKTGRRYFTFGNATGSYSHPACGDLFLTDINLRSSVSAQDTVEYGMEILACDGIWLQGGHIGNAADANILFNGNTNEYLNLVYITSVMVDEGAGYAVYFDGNTAPIYNDIKFSNVTLKGAGLATYGFGTSATCSALNVRLNGCSISEFKYHGVNIQSSNFRNIRFNGTDVYGNAVDTGAASSGYYFGTGARDISISGGSSGKKNTTMATSLQKYGVEFSSGHSNILINSVDLTGNATASTFGGSTGVKATNCMVDAVTIASTATLAISVANEVFTVSGTTDIQGMTAGYTGRRVSLKFQGILTVKHNVGNIRLRAKADYVTAADDVLNFVYDGAAWSEI